MSFLVDSLHVAIEGDAQGLSSVFQKGLKDAKGFIEQMNDQQVNWKSIFAKSLSPALISGIAGTVALAITKALSFQNDLAKASATASTSFADSSGTMSQAALGISKSTGVAAGDVAAALGSVSHYYKDTAMQSLIAESASKLAAAGFGDVNDIAIRLAATLDAWAIKSVPEAKDAIDALVIGARNGEFSLFELTDAIRSSGEALRTSTSISEATASLAALSTQVGFTKVTALNAFNVIADAVLSPKTNMTAMAAGFGNIAAAVKDGGVEQAMLNFENHIRTNSLMTQEFAATIGLSAQTVKSFADTSSEDVERFKNSIASLKTEFKDGLNKTVNDSTSAIKSLKISWNAFEVALTSSKEATNMVSQLAAAFGTLASNIQESGVVMGTLKASWEGTKTYFSDMGSMLQLLNMRVNDYNRASSATTVSTDASISTTQQLMARQGLTSLLGSALSGDQIRSFISKGTASGLSLQDLLSGAQGSAGNKQNVFNSTFNIHNSGSEKLTGEKILSQLYSEFQGQH